MQGRLGEAIAAYEKIISINPNEANVYSNMGATLKSQGKYDEAISAYMKALAVNPDYFTAHYNLGIILQEQGQAEEALVSYNKAIELKPDFTDAYINLGTLLVKLGKVEEAIKTLKSVLKITPDHFVAKYNLSNALKQIGKFDEAGRYFVEFPSVSDQILKKFVTWHKDLGWCPPPGLRKTDINETSMSGHSFNKASTNYCIDYRGARIGFPFWDPKSTQKIALFGDSFCMSREVADNETIGWHLSERSKCAVENYGVGGYGLDQAFLRLKHVLSVKNKKEKLTDILLIITPYTLARAVSVYRHYLEPGNTLAVKPRAAISRDGSLFFVPSPLKKKTDLKSLSRFSDHFHKWDRHYKEKAWVVKNKVEYYASFWKLRKSYFLPFWQS